MALGCANAVYRYIPTSKDILNKGYAGLSSCFFYRRLPLVAGEGEKMAETIVNNIEKEVKH